MITPDQQVSFWRRVDKAGLNGCWPWNGGKIRDGYGLATFSRKTYRAHRLSYELLIGPIPDGLQLDHLCRVRDCVNPAHLEAVTSQENTRRGKLAEARKVAADARKACGRGHSWSPENTRLDKNGKRSCRSCARDRTRRHTPLIGSVPSGALRSVVGRNGCQLSLSCGHEVIRKHGRQTKRARCPECEVTRPATVDITEIEEEEVA